MSIFIDTELRFGISKSAGMLTPLSDNVEQWNSEILSEAFSQVPYLSEFQVTVQLIQVDENKGTGYGSVVVASIPRNQGRPTQSPKLVMIPVIIKDSKMSPLDVFQFNGMYYPLNEERLRAALFQPETFSATGNRPPESSIYSTLQPPVETTKIGSALVALQGKVNATQCVEFQEKLKEASLLNHISTVATPGVRAAFHTAAQLEPISQSDLDTVKTACVPPDVIQVNKTDTDTYQVNWANCDLYEKTSQLLDRRAAKQLVKQAFKELEQKGSVVFSTKESKAKILKKHASFGLIDRHGTWVVQDVSGKQLAGIAIPTVTLTGQPSDFFVFTNGINYSYQPLVAGRYSGEATVLPEDPFGGFGILYHYVDGEAVCFPPMRVVASSVSPDGEAVYSVSLPHSGLTRDICFFAELSSPSVGIDGVICLPASYKWMLLDEENPLSLVDEPSQVLIDENVKTAELIYDGASYSLRGFPYQNLDSSRHFMTKSAAEFLAVAGGLHPKDLPELFSLAELHGSVKFASSKAIIPHHLKLKEAKALLAQDLSSLDLPKPQFLLKEAAVIPNTLTVDRILSLGFITPENLATFVTLIPEFERTLSSLAELLIAIRLGITEVPETAVERALVALDYTVKGLKTLKNKEVKFS